VNAVIRRELTRLERRPSHYLVRAILAVITLYLGGAIAFCGWSMLVAHTDLRLADILRSGPEIAERAMLELAWTQMLAMFLILPALAASAISEEDRRGTMAHLLATPLTSGAIVLGKLAGPLVHAMTIVLAGLPLVVPALLLGLLDPLLVARAWLMLAVLAVFVVSLSVFVAAVISRPRAAIPTAYGTIVTCVLLPIWLTPLARGLSGPWVWIKTINECVLLSHPSESALGLSIPWTRLYGDPSTDIGWVWLGLSRLYIDPSGVGLIWGTLPRTLTRVVVPQLVTALLCLIGAALVLRPRRLGLPGWDRLRMPLRGSSAIRRTSSLPAVGDDPMFWKESRATGKPSRSLVQVGIVFLCVTMLIPLLEPIRTCFFEWTAGRAENGAGMWERARLNESLRSLSTALYLMSLLVMAVAAAASVTAERDHGSWTGLLASPLAGWEVARAKVLGVALRMLWLVLPFEILGVIGVATGSIHPVGFATAGLTVIVFGLYAASLGVCCSMLSATSDRAILATLAVLWVSNTFPLICIPSGLIGPVAGSKEGLLLAGVTPLVHWISLVSPIEIQAAAHGWLWEATIRLPFTFWTVRIPVDAGLIRLYGISILLHLLGALGATWLAAWAFEASRRDRTFVSIVSRNFLFGRLLSRVGYRVTRLK
jgi:ABC-type transport system involved in multi-copper enzyme maturation permease subunit